MSNPPFRYGAMTPTDMIVLEESVKDSIQHNELRFLELGAWKGDTARGVSQLCAQQKCELDYWAIDIAAPDPMPDFKTFHFIQAHTWPAPAQLPKDFSCVLVDACHCILHVVLDIMAYAPLVKQGGCMIFHDTAPHLQHVQTNPWIHPEREPFLTAVTDAIEVCEFPWKGWELETSLYEPQCPIGGMRVYRRLI